MSYVPSSRRGASSQRGKSLSTFSFDDTSTDDIDKDILFSPSHSEQNSSNTSPVGNKDQKSKYDDSFIFNNQSKPVTTEKYLSNLISDSNDLDDSILGGLMGGPTKKTVRPPTIEPISSLNKSNRQSQSQFVSSPSPTSREVAPGEKAQSATSLHSEPLASISGAPRRNKVDLISSIPAVNKGRRNNSYDDNDDSTNDLDNNTNSYIPTPALPSRISANESHDASKARHGSSVQATQAAIPPLSSATSNAEKRDYQAEEEDANGNDAAGSFIPSFLEPGRQGRRRRYVLSLHVQVSPLQSTFLCQAVGRQFEVSRWSRWQDNIRRVGCCPWLRQQHCWRRRKEGVITYNYCM